MREFNIVINYFNSDLINKKIIYYLRINYTNAFTKYINFLFNFCNRKIIS